MWHLRCYVVNCVEPQKAGSREAHSNSRYRLARCWRRWGTFFILTSLCRPKHSTRLTVIPQLLTAHSHTSDGPLTSSLSEGKNFPTQRNYSIQKSAKHGRPVHTTRKTFENVMGMTSVSYYNQAQSSLAPNQLGVSQHLHQYAQIRINTETVNLSIVMSPLHSNETSHLPIAE